MTDVALPATERLYWTQPQAQHFDAEVVATDGPHVALNRTLFYPEGGGQPCDTGTLTWNGAAVQITDVQKRGGVIWHTLTGDVPPPGQRVSGELDWARRHRHSQRHTAEHLLAQAFSRVLPQFAVQSVSMRGSECTLDLAGQPSEAHAQAAQQLLMSMLRHDLILDTQVVTADQLTNFPLRRPPQVSGNVRVVLFRTPDGEIWEASACGGTHLPRASMAAPVVILRLERIKGGLTRVVFMAGEEATERLSQVYGQALSLARSFSTSLDLLPLRVQDTRDELTAQTAETDHLRRELAAVRWHGAAHQQIVGGTFTCVQLDDERLLRPLLDQAARQPQSVTAVVCSSGQCGIASSLTSFPAGTLLRAWLEAAGGRGGGRPELAQGQTTSPSVFLETAAAWAVQNAE
ncbi:alanyl-tRNA editing protein [Deinococcus ruber]|uniref:Serine-tRNA(Ala) deacylase n=1 Tax=Deinococcus ruber TaxID=1848197 RepID=A0A918KVG1_9DEIO|nr:alanyl-tRNA editing protein [Deinococcus ruber]GGR35775.1 serine-tRNA(Ala) deacylase [Deinococcus ruber]